MTPTTGTKQQSKRGHQRRVLLSFDLEEFDVPAEYGIDLAFEEQIRISKVGLETILDLLDAHNIKATFFTTVVFAQQEPALIKRIVATKHELGSHGWYHSTFENAHLAQSRDKLQELFGADVKGFRMARMMDVDHAAISNAGYTYNSSMNPVFLPGRYNNFFKPRTLFEEDGIFHIPASATPLLRLPLFWLSFHHLPLWFYQAACARTMRRDDYLNIYFHPWEFADLLKVHGLPSLITRKSGLQMAERFERLLMWMQGEGYQFETLNEFLAQESDTTTG